jgi:cytochrome c oxidase subunit 2
MPEPTFLKLTSADVNHSFWVAQFAAKADLIANHVNAMWIDPQVAGLYL